MIDRDIAVETLWPQARALLIAVLQGNEGDAHRLLDRDGSAAELLDLFGLPALEIVLKTVLERPQVGLSRVVVDEEQFVYLEYLWLDDGAAVEDPFAHEGAVTLRMRQQDGRWAVYDINPDHSSRWLTECAARGQLASWRAQHNGALPQTPAVLAPAFLAGQLPLPLRPTGLADAVEQRLLPTMQQHGFGAYALLAARRLWRDFLARRGDLPAALTADPALAALWAAAAELAMSEQAGVQTTQATIAKAYGAPLTRLFGPLRQIKDALGIAGPVARYSPHTGVELLTT